MTLSRRSALSLGTVGMAAAAVSLAPSAVIASSKALGEARAAAGEARAAYHLALESGKLPARVLDLAEQIYRRHRAHEEAWQSFAGGGSAGLDQPEVQGTLDAARNSADVLRLMRDIEARALEVYLAEHEGDAEVQALLAAAAADCAMHWTLLNHALGDPLPAEALAAGGALPRGGTL